MFDDLVWLNLIVLCNFQHLKTLAGFSRKGEKREIKTLNNRLFFVYNLIQNIKCAPLFMNNIGFLVLIE